MGYLLTENVRVGGAGGQLNSEPVAYNNAAVCYAQFRDREAAGTGPSYVPSVVVV